MPESVLFHMLVAPDSMKLLVNLKAPNDFGLLLKEKAPDDLIKLKEAPFESCA